MISLAAFLFTPLDKTPRSRLWFWLALSLLFAVIYAIAPLQKAFAAEYVVQDDARQHVFWMRRWLDPALFPADAIADYFQSVAPWGYAGFYRALTALGVDPLLLHKLLPLPLALLTTGFAFGVAIQLLPLPLAGFLSSLLLNQSLWMKDDLVSGTPTAFALPIFWAFLYFLLRRSIGFTVITILLLGGFYPQFVLVAAALLLLRLPSRSGQRWQLGDRSTRRLTLAGLAASLLALLPYILRSSPFGPVLTGDLARSLPTLAAGGWSAFFSPHPWTFWICGGSSSLLPSEWCEAGYKVPDLFGLLPRLRVTLPFLLPQVGLALLLPWLRRRSPLDRWMQPQIAIVPQLLLASIGCFLLAHLALFRLHLPSRYTEHSFRMVAALASGIALTLLLEKLVRSRQSGSPSELSSELSSAQPDSPPPRRRANGQGILKLAIVTALLLLYPSQLWFEGATFPVTNYITGKFPELYEFLAQQPPSTVVASIAPEINNLPSFASRSIAVGGKGYTLPYHLGYYREMNQRTIALLQAQYSPNLAVAQQFIRDRQVTYWLLERSAFQPEYLASNPVAIEYAAETAMLVPASSALAKRQADCTAWQTDRLLLLDAACILRSEP